MKDSREIIHTKTNESKTEIEKPFDGYDANVGRYPMYRNANQGEGLGLIEYWRAIRKRLWLVIGITILITTLTAIYMSRKPNIYEAKGRVQVDLEQSNPELNVSERRLPLANSDPAYFNTQVQLLNSDKLLRRVVKELSLDSNKEFQSAKNEESVSALQAMLRAVGLASKEEKKKSGTIDEVTVGTGLGSAEEVNEAVRLAPYVEMIRKKLRIEPIKEARGIFKDTRLIEIGYQHTNEQFAATVVNGIAEVFTKQNQEKRTGKNKETTDFLTDRIASLEAQVKNDEIRLADLKNRVGTLKSSEDQTIVGERLAILNKDLLEAENKRKIAEAEYNSVKNNPERLNAIVEEKLQRSFDERETDMRQLSNDTTKKIAELESQKAGLMQVYQESAPEVEEINNKIKSLREVIEKRQKENQKSFSDYRDRTRKEFLTQLQTRYEQVKGAEDKIRSSYNEQYGKAEGESRASIDIRLLEQTLETNRGFLKNLKEQQSANDVVALGTDNNISVVDPAIPPEKPIGPNRFLTVLTALFLSTLFGMGLALFLEFLDDTIKTTEEVESYLQLPALAAIPTIDVSAKKRLLLVGANSEGEEANGKNNLLIHTDSRSSIAEAYRQLRTSILLSTAGHAPKSLLITSSLPAEGKTTTAVNTAISLAQTGAKVLVVDADMRRPRLHSIFNVSNAQGLSTILSSDMDEHEVLNVLQYEKNANLYLLPSGPVPPNPAELIGSEQMSLLMKQLQGVFTHVVVDSPPIASFTDGVLIASMVDGVILVVHSGKSSRQVVKRARQFLQDVGARVFGVVLNNVNLRSQENYYYYQSYYHRSNYNYDDE